MKAFLSGLAVIALVLVPACKHTTKPVQVQPVLDTTPTVPVVVPQPPQPPRVEPNTDFVKTDTTPEVVSSALPSNLEDLNRVAQERGLIQDAFFGYDESALTADGQTALTNSAKWLNGNEGHGYNILIEGHCDERGTEQYNLALGDKRANIAKEYLQTLGVDASRIRTVSYGEERPFDPGHEEASWAKNRRAHVVIVGK
jgi:peptidoglycan-associated lipoprotein